MIDPLSTASPEERPDTDRVQHHRPRRVQIFYRHPSTPDMQASLDKAVEQHDQIIAAIERHDAEAAGALVRAHLDLSRHRMADYAAPEGVEVPLVY